MALESTNYRHQMICKSQKCAHKFLCSLCSHKNNGGGGHSGRNALKNGKTTKTAKNGKLAKKISFFVTVGCICTKFVIFGLVLTIFEVILPNSAINLQKHDGRLLLGKICETKFVNKIQKIACFKVNFDPFLYHPCSYLISSDLV
jgi:hypothetical protein